MSEGRDLPPARERNRFGLRSLDWQVRPSAEEAGIDRVSIRVPGSLHASSTQDLMDYLALINPGPGLGRLERDFRLFSSGNWTGRKFLMPLARGTALYPGALDAYRRDQSARLALALTLNPTRTLAHLLTRFGPGEFDDLPPTEFFRLVPDVPAMDVSLDRRDNLIADANQIGGSVYAARAAHWASYLQTYERALWRLLVDFLCPVEQGFHYEDRDGSLVACNDRIEVVLDVDDVALLQCEVYWERHTRSALEFVRSFADRALAASRAVRVHTYDLPENLSLERIGGAMSVLMPLASNVDFAVYAKALDRVRFEVRYKSDLPQNIRNVARPGGNRLYRLWEAARNDALDRLPWDGLAHLMEPASDGNVSVLLDLLEAVQRSCTAQPGLERGVLEMLLLTGGVSSTGPEGAAPERIVQALVSQGVVERVRLRRREERGPGRRFRLTRRYADLPARVGTSGLPAPAQSAAAEPFL